MPSILKPLSAYSFILAADGTMAAAYSLFFFIHCGGLHGDAHSFRFGLYRLALFIKGTSVFKSLAMLKFFMSKSPSVSSYEYHFKEKSLAPTGMRQMVKLAP